jgi:uncharacterized protein with HEPN domain
MLSERTKRRLRDIIEDVQRVETFLDGMILPVFLGEERTIFAVERLLQRITEAAIQIDPADAERIGPGLPVAQMRALGNRLRHEYFDVNRAILFDIASRELPILRASVELALEQG